MNETKKNYRLHLHLTERAPMTGLEVVAVAYLTITAYAPGCGATGQTKAQTWPTSGHSVAVDRKRFRLGTLFHIPELSEGRPFIAVDTGRLIVDDTMDVYMDSCKAARKWGRRHGVKVFILRSKLRKK